MISTAAPSLPNQLSLRSVQREVVPTGTETFLALFLPDPADVSNEPTIMGLVETIDDDGTPTICANAENTGDEPVTAGCGEQDVPQFSPVSAPLVAPVVLSASPQHADDTVQGKIVPDKTVSSLQVMMVERPCLPKYAHAPDGSDADSAQQDTLGHVAIPEADRDARVSVEPSHSLPTRQANPPVASTSAIPHLSTTQFEYRDDHHSDRKVLDFGMREPAPESEKGIPDARRNPPSSLPMVKGKDLSLSRRTALWDNSIADIPVETRLVQMPDQNPVTGVPQIAVQQAKAHQPPGPVPGLLPLTPEIAPHTAARVSVTDAPLANAANQRPAIQPQGKAIAKHDDQAITLASKKRPRATLVTAVDAPAKSVAERVFATRIAYHAEQNGSAPTTKPSVTAALAQELPEDGNVGRSAEVPSPAPAEIPFDVPIALMTGEIVGNGAQILDPKMQPVTVVAVTETSEAAPTRLPDVVRHCVEIAANKGTDTVELRLDPAELGSVRVTMRAQEQDIIVVVMVERPETLDLLRKHADQFISDLRQSGYAGASLTFNMADQQGYTQRQPIARPVLELDPLSAPPPQHQTINTTSGLDMRL